MREEFREEFREKFENYLTRLRANDPTLNTLCLNHDQIGDDGAAALAETLKINGTLTELFLFNNMIRGDGATALATALEVNKALTTLNLNYNKIGNNGTAALAEALKVNGTLTELRLDYNQIGPAGAASLAEALRRNRAIAGLDLSRNQIGDDGAVAIAQALRDNSTLIDLDLSRNQITDAGAMAIAQALRENGSLTKLDLSRNQITDAGAMAIAQALRENGSLTKLAFFRDNQIGNVGTAAIEEGLQHVIVNKKMLREGLFGEVAEKYRDLNKLSGKLPVLPTEVYLTITKDFLSAILLVRGSVQDKLEFVEMSNLEDLRLPNKDESAYLIAKAFEKYRQDVRRTGYFGAEVARSICANDSVLLKGFDQLYGYDERLGSGITFLQESEEEGKIYKTATKTPFNQVRVDLDTLSRMLTKDVEKPEGEREYKAIRGWQVEIKGLDFAQIVQDRRPVLLLNIFRIAKGVPSLMTTFVSKMQANDNALLNIVVEMMPHHPTLQEQLQQVIDRVGKITEITDKGFNHDKKRSHNEDSASKSDHAEQISQPSPASKGTTVYQLRNRVARRS